MEWTEELKVQLIQEALKSRKFAYVPYSGFAVGAALLCRDGSIFGGCNVENAAYTPTNCAERTAVFKAVSEGKRDFVGIAVAGGKTDGEMDYCSPCGVCRQVLMEFCDPGTFLVLMAKNEKEYQVKTLEELLPMGFGPGNLR